MGEKAWTLLLVAVCLAFTSVLAQDADEWLAVINNQQPDQEQQEPYSEQREQQPRERYGAQYDEEVQQAGRRGEDEYSQYEEEQYAPPPPQRRPPPPQRLPPRPKGPQRPPGQFQRIDTQLPQRGPPPPQPKPQGILDGISGAIQGAVGGVTCAATGLYADDKLNDPAFIQAQFRCLQGQGECDEVGALVKRMAPDILRGGCPPPCDPCRKKQIQKVMATLSQRYPQKFQELIRQFGR